MGDELNYSADFGLSLLPTSIRLVIYKYYEGKDKIDRRKTYIAILTFLKSRNFPEDYARQEASRAVAMSVPIRLTQQPPRNFEVTPRTNNTCNYIHVRLPVCTVVYRSLEGTDLLSHFALISRIDDKGHPTHVVHASGPEKNKSSAIIQESTFNEFLAGNMMFTIREYNPEKCFSPNVIVEKARSLVGLNYYHAELFNCEGFVMYCVLKNPQRISSQAKGVRPFNVYDCKRVKGDRYKIFYNPDLTIQTKDWTDTPVTL